MARYHGIQADTYRRFVIDSGEVRTGYVDGNNTGTRIGATRGGSAFTIEQEIRDMAVDGAKGPVKGGRRITKVNAKLEVNFVEFTPSLLNMALPGSTTTEEALTHMEIKRALQIALTDYKTNIALIGEVSGSGDPIIIILDNVLADGNFEITAADNDESVLKVQFTAHFDPASMDTEPWTIKFPTDVLTTEGA